MLKTIRVQETTWTNTTKIKLREGHHSQDETLSYLNNLDKQVRKLGGIAKIVEKLKCG